jgi:hypothetical protein
VATLLTFACECTHMNAQARVRDMKMQTLSVRIPTEDIEWLAGLDIQGAVSPSDKLRALIGQIRRQHEGTLDYERGVAWLRDLVAPFVTAIRAVEHQNRMHSEALTLAAEWLPQIMATLLSERSLAKDQKARAADIEALVVQRCFQLLASLMRLAITRNAGCYSPDVIDQHLPAVLEIADVVTHTRKFREDNRD